MSTITRYYPLTTETQEPGSALIDPGVDQTSTWFAMAQESGTCGPYLHQHAQFSGSSGPILGIRYTNTLVCSMSPSTVVDDIPPGAIITGIEVQVYRYGTRANFGGTVSNIVDFSMKLRETDWAGNTLNTSSDLAARTNFWPLSTFSAATYGSYNNLWGLSSVNPTVNRYVLLLEAMVGLNSVATLAEAHVGCVSIRFYYLFTCTINCDAFMTATNDINAPHISTATAGDTVYYWASADSGTCGAGSPADWTRLWTFGDGTTSAYDTGYHVYAQPGTYPWNLSYHYTGQIGTADCVRTGEMVVSPGACVLSCSGQADVPFGDAPHTVNFTMTTGTAQGTCGTTGYTYHWDLGDGSTSALQNPTHTYTNPGNYLASFTVTDNSTGNVCTGSGIGIVVNTPSSNVCGISCSASPSASSGNVPFSVTFVPSITYNPYCTDPPVYVWDFGDGSATSSTYSPTHQYTVAGTYNWTFSVTRNSVTCTTGGTIVASPAQGGGTPSVNITGPADGATLPSNTFTAMWIGSGGTPPLRYTYQLDGLAPVNAGATTSHTFSGVADGSHTLTVTAIDSVNVSSAPDTVTFTVSGGGVTGFTVNFTATPGGDTYNWNFGDGQTDSGTSNQITHVYASAGVYTATVSVSFNNCPVAVDSVVVNLSNTLFNTDFTFSPNNLDVTFTPSSSGGINPTGPRYYIFDFADNGVDGYYYIEDGTGTSAPSFHHIFDASGQYDVGLIAVEGGQVDAFVASAAQTVFSSSSNFVLQTAIVLMGPDTDHLLMLTRNTHYTENESAGEGTGITLISPAVGGEIVRIGYVLVNTPAYSLTAVASHLVSATAPGALNISLNIPSGNICFSPNGTIGRHNFTATITGGVGPYTVSWLPDSDCTFNGTDSTGYTLKLAGVLQNCSSPIVHTASGSTDTLSNVTYNPPEGSVGVAKNTHLVVSVTDSSSPTPLTGSATISLSFAPLPVASASGSNNYAGDLYRFQSNNTTTTTPAIGTLYRTNQAVVLGVPMPPGKSYSYSWTPSTYLAPSGSVPTPSASLPYNPSVLQQLYTVTVTDNVSPNCINTGSTTVIKPTVTIASVTEDTGWSGAEPCYRRVALQISSFNPKDAGLAFVVERVQGTSGAVSILGADGTTLPKILDRAVYGACDGQYAIGTTLGGICLLDPQHRTLAGGTNRIAMKMSTSQSTPFTIYVLDPICSSTPTVSHDYRVRVIDISGSNDIDVTETAVLGQYDTVSGVGINSVSISNDMALTFSNVNTCSASLIINPSSRSYNVVGAPWSQQIALSESHNGFTPISWTWSFDGLGHFNGSGYSYTVTNDGTASPIVTYVNSNTTSVPSKIGRVRLSCTGHPIGSQQVITVNAEPVDYTINYSEACSISCSDIVVNNSTGLIPLTVNFTAFAVASNCPSSSISYSWVFGDGGTGSGPSVSHTYTTAGVYTATVTATVVGTTTTCSRSITITATDTCTANSCTASVNGSTSVNTTVGSTVTLGGNLFASGGGCGSIPTVSWSFSCPGASPNVVVGTEPFGGSIVGATVSPVTVTAQTPGSYIWTLTWDLGNGSTCQSDVSVNITAGCSCTVSTSGTDTTGWVGSPSTFNAVSTPSNCSGSPTYYWTFGDGGTSSSQNPVHTYTTAGIKYWSVTASYGAASCSANGSISICDLSCSISAPSTSQPGSPIAMSATVSTGPCTLTGLIYDWDFGDGTAHGTGQNVSHTYTTIGTKTVTLTVTHPSSGRYSTCTKQISIQPCNVAACTWSGVVNTPGDGWVYQFEDTASITSMQYLANTTLGSGGQLLCGTLGDWDWTWTFPCGSKAPTASGSSVIQNWTSGTSCSPSIVGPKTVYVDVLYQGNVVCSQKAGQIKIISFVASANVPSTADVGQVVNFVGNAPIVSGGTISGGINYNWDFGDGGTSTLQSPSHAYSTSGTYTWTLTCSTSQGQGTNARILTSTTSGTITIGAVSPCTNFSGVASATIVGYLSWGGPRTCLESGVGEQLLITKTDQSAPNTCLSGMAAGVNRGQAGPPTIIPVPPGTYRVDVGASHSSATLNPGDCWTIYCSVYFCDTGDGGCIQCGSGITSTTKSAVCPSSISGRVYDVSTGQPIDGANITAVGAQAYSTTTSLDFDGYWSIALPAGTYTVTCSLSGYTFAPASRTLTVGSGTNITGVDFTTTTYSISGRVVKNDMVTGKPNAQIKVSGGPLGSTIVSGYTDANGDYSIPVPGNGTYSLWPNTSVNNFCQNTPGSNCANKVNCLPKVEQSAPISVTVSNANVSNINLRCCTCTG